MKNILLQVLLVLFALHSNAQNFSHRDSLHGSLRPERTNFDVQRYDLNITVNPDKKYISGFNDITFTVVDDASVIQLDLFENMKIDSLVLNKKQLKYKRDGDAVFITFSGKLKKGSDAVLRFYYSGNPQIALNAPWDGGFVSSKDSNGKPWIGVAVQGTGASLWYPVKDHQSDEPDKGASIKVAVPNGLMNVSNGRFKGCTDLKNGYTRWDWEVKNPINNYNITVNIADYVHIHDNHKGLDLDYYVLRKNEEKAIKHFEEVKPMMDCYQSKFGEYPFIEDGYKLVETPYLGMEHQSAVAYGNNYQKGYRGMDMSMSGIGKLFDYITIHETAHEWFGNSITSSDIADMWIHESFTTYAETVFVECVYGYEKAMKYNMGARMGVSNDRPLVGIFGVNKSGSGDMYPKGSLMLNTLRHTINDDDKWWRMLLKYSETYKKQVINGETVVAFFSKESGMDLQPFFDQYLRYRAIPVLELKLNGTKAEYRWKTNVTGYNIPVGLVINDKEVRVDATNNWQVLEGNYKNLSSIELQRSRFFVLLDKL